MYEQDFLPCSYGFRPGRAAHQALQVGTAIMSQGRLYGVDIEREIFRSDLVLHLRDFDFGEFTMVLSDG